MSRADQNISPECMIAIEHLRKSFGSNHVLTDFSMCLHKRENVVVLGKSGSGKSVLIKCISGLIMPDGGLLNVLGSDMLHATQKQVDEVRARLGFLFQGGALYDSMTVEDNLEFTLVRRMKKLTRKEISMMIDEALDNVGLRSALKMMPSELSGGMRKRIALARALILKPEIMLYDEPTTGLDPITAREISHLILSVQERYQTSSVIITHDMVCTRVTANRIIVLANGKCHAEGTYSELEKLPDPQVKGFFE